MDIIILSGQRPNCAICGNPLESWNPLIEEEECVPCIANKISDELMKSVEKALSTHN